MATTKCSVHFGPFVRLWFCRPPIDGGFRREINERVKAQGFRVASALDGVSGVQAALNYPADAIILDYDMPNGRGDVVIDLLKGNEGRNQAKFDEQSDQVIELVQERMKNYEDALWGGVAMVRASGGDVDFEQWNEYATSLNVEKKYPGINGIGVIHALTENDVPGYLAKQRIRRPEYAIQPPHGGNEFYPSTYIIPVCGNEKAVGRDMAHEMTRLSAAQRSRDTGQSQITGRIALVQDADQTPGFLFYAPIYQGGPYTSESERQLHFTGLVYAPFVVKKLMDGVLEKDKRQVGIRLVDHTETIYDEHVASEPDYDPEPQFVRTVEVPLYGRIWTFDVWSTKSFRQASSSSQPFLILVGGITLDVLLILLFVAITRTSRQALGYADAMTYRLEAKTEQLEASQALTAERAKQLEQSNHDLEQFACVASHDLQEPLRKVAMFCGLLDQEYGSVLNKEGRSYVNYAIDGACRMRSLIQDLLTYSKIGSSLEIDSTTDATTALQSAVIDLAGAIDQCGARITYDALPVVNANPRQLTQLFQNLVGNAIKYRGEDSPGIHIGVESRTFDWLFSVSDNGIGIAPEYHVRVFGIFKRLHSNREYEGTGIGLAICKRIIERMNGKIWIETKPDPGCTICFTIPKIQIDSQNDRKREHVHACSH